jgi:glutamate synthase (NADPH/NADH) small chain
LTLGIPGFKLEKEVVQRRLQLMQEEGVEFCTGAHVGINYSLYDLRSGYDAIVLAGGSTQARNLDVPGRELDGIHFAMEYLPQQNRLDMGQSLDGTRRIDAEGRRVVILGGGDTGADCLGTAHRQGAEVVHQLEILSQPPDARAANNPWPEWPIVLRPSAAHEEGGLTNYAVATKAFTGENGHVSALHAVYVEWTRGENGRPVMQEIEGSDFQIETELVLLALGFLHPEHEGMINDLGVELDARGNVSVNRDKATSEPGIFAAGDMARGQSLVVWAIAEGRAAAHGVDKYLMGSSGLPWVATKFDRR